MNQTAVSDPSTRQRRFSVALRPLILLAALVSATTGTSSASDVSNGVVGPQNAVFRQGMWWDPYRDGSGWDLGKSGDYLFAIWYTYDVDGQPIWYTSSARLSDNRFQGELLKHQWDLATDTHGIPERVGELDIEFPHPQRAVVNWQLGEESGTRELEPFRFAFEPTLEDFSGTWFDPGEPGYGITIQTQSDLTFAVVYRYDEDGNPTWRSGAGVEGSREFPLSRSRGACPSCPQEDAEYEADGAIDMAFTSETQMQVRLETGDGSWDRADVDHEMISDPPSGRPHPSAMAYLASAEALRFFFRNAWYERQAYVMPIICTPPIVSPAPPTPPAPTNGLVSQTNVQEVGVDEPDLVKATTNQLFMIDHPSHFDRPAVVDDEGVTTALLQRISQYGVAVDAGHPALETIYEVEYPLDERRDWSILNEGIYHHVAQDGTERLLFQGTQAAYGCFSTGQAYTRLVTWKTDESEGAEPEIDLTLDGEIITSRRIGDRLFVLTTYRPDFHALAERVLPPELLKDVYSFDEFRDILAAAEAEDLLPRVYREDGEPTPLVNANQIMVPPFPAERVDPHLSVLSMFDLNDLAAPPQSMAIMGRTDGLYATPQSVWLASSRTQLSLGPGGQIEWGPYADTDLHRFAIEDGALSYSGSGSVEGSVGWEPTRLAFRLSEWDGALRVLTHSSSWQDRWDERGSNRLTVLSTEADSDLLLATRAILPNAERPERIGKPGESVFAVRFFGERGYVVTFERIDPLYALDLSDPEDPFVLGGLEIPGYSDYLHPIDDKLLLGVGMQVVTINEGMPNAQTVELGVQVGLFDVGEPTAPVQLDRDIIGDRGSATPVLGSHRAFTWLPGDPDLDRQARIAFPVVEHGPVEGVEPGRGLHPYQPWRKTGIVQYELARAGGDAWLERLGIAPVVRREDIREDAIDRFRHAWPGGLRSVIHSDRLMMSYEGGLWIGDWGFTDPLAPAEGCERCALEGLKGE